MSQLDLVLEEGKRLKQELRERTLGYILTALGLVAGLAWNEAIQSLIAVIFPSEKDTVSAKFSYAVIITLVVVILATYLTKYFHRESHK